MTQSLLAKAKQLPTYGKKNNYTDEELELVRAWLTDEVTISQIARVTKRGHPTRVYVFLALGARELIRRENQ